MSTKLENLHAYDYDAQRWVSGIDAFWLRTRQLMEERELLLEEPGYAAAMGVPVATLGDHIVAIEDEIRRLWS